MLPSMPDMKVSFGGSWKSTATGIVSGVLAIVAASQATSLKAALLDFKVQIAVVLLINGLVSRDASESGDRQAKEKVEVIPELKKVPEVV